MADDKRIRELQTETGLIDLSWVLPFDAPGLIAAQKRTMQQAVNTLNANRSLQTSLTGATNPDNALGNNGDTYYKFVSGAEFGIWFKTNDIWSQLFTIDLTPVAPVTLTGIADGSGNVDLSAVTAIPLWGKYALYGGDGNNSAANYNGGTRMITGMTPGETYHFTY